MQYLGWFVLSFRKRKEQKKPMINIYKIFKHFLITHIYILKNNRKIGLTTVFKIFL